jgi:hypothetical protein
MDTMTREQMEAEFGAPGVQNPKVMDLITVDPMSDRVVLAMFERRAWGQGPQQIREIEEKINRYLGYALDGFLVQHYPKYEGKDVQIRLDCAEAPHGEAVTFIEAARRAIEAQGIAFAVNVTSATTTSSAKQ